LCCTQPSLVYPFAMRQHHLRCTITSTALLPGIPLVFFRRIPLPSRSTLFPYTTLFRSVLPLSLGLETRGGIYTKIIERNSTIPLRNSLTFTTVVDNQSSVEIHVLQGEREIAKGNRSLGKFELVGIPSAPRGVPQIEVSFEVDANGIVSVAAADKATGREQQMRITPTSGLSQDEIERIINEAQSSAESDRALRDKVDLNNKLTSLVKNTQRAFLEFGGLLSK